MLLAIRVLPLVVLLGIAGCGSGSVAKVPVSGSIKSSDGKPCDNTLVVLHPQDPAKLNDPKPFAKTDADGNFKLTTQSEGDGAEPGRYGVTLVWQSAGKESKFSLSGEGGDSGGGDKLKGKYGNPSKPLIEVEVKTDGSNTFTWTVEP